MSLLATPGKHHLNHWEAAGAQRQSRGETVAEVTESKVAARHSHSALICHELQSERSPDGVLEALLQQQEIRRAKPVVLIAAERQIAVDALPAQGLLKIERHRAACRVHGLGQEKPESNRSIQVPRAGNIRALLARRRALIRTGQRIRLGP